MRIPSSLMQRGKILNISCVSANQAKKLTSSSRKFVLIFLKDNEQGDELVKVKPSLEGCTKEWKHQLEDIL
jgi:hypothetical protein